MTGVRAIGWKAHAALARARGRVASIPGFDGSAYRHADGELVWLGGGGAMHPRAVVLDVAERGVQYVRVDGVTPWRPAAQRIDVECATALRAASIALAADVVRIGVPRGFAALLAGERLAFPLDQALPHVAALARGIDDDDAEGAAQAALPLLGLGPGLTPSGDDFVGAALFARRICGMTPAWHAAAQRLIAAAQTRTHAIAATLFRDLAEGESYAPLHALAARLTSGVPALEAAQALTAIGHSSGWDMLAGFIIGAAGRAALQTGVA